MKKRSKMVLAASILALSLTACNAVQGLGRDIESVGEAGEEAIN